MARLVMFVGCVLMLAACGDADSSGKRVGKPQRHLRSRRPHRGDLRCGRSGEGPGLQPVTGFLHRWIYPALLVPSLVLAACGGGSDGPGDRGNGEYGQLSEIDPGPDIDQQVQSGGNEGDPGAFRLGVAGWENACTLLSNDEVAAATGLIVLEAREVGGCTWVVDAVDENIVAGAESSIGWLPMRARDFDIQKEVAPRVSSDIIVEPFDGLGKQAFWQGNTLNSLGEMWVQTEQISFRVVNQFATFEYSKDTREPMRKLAAAIVESLNGIDVIAASGESGQGLIPPVKVDLPDGIPTMDGILDELTAVPLPEGAVYGSGNLYQDRASQDIYLDLSVGDTARFYLEALPAAGFEIVPGGTTETEDQVLEYASQSIAFTDPGGRRGDVHIGEGAFAPTKLGIQIYLGG